MSVRHLAAAARGPAAPGPDDASLPRRDLDAAVAVAVHREGHLLAAGERAMVRRYQALPDPARALVARLLARQPASLLLSGLDYAEIPNVGAAAGALWASGWAEQPHRRWPRARLAPHLTVPELQRALRAAGQPTRGRKAALLDRVTTQAVPLDRAQPRIALRHRGLLRRLIRLALHDAQGDLQRLVLARLGVVRYPTYTPTAGAGLWPTRRALVSWERALARRARLEGDALVADLPRALAAVEATPRAAPLRHRWSARRHEEGLALRAAALLEKRGEHEQAAQAYARLLAAGARDEPVARQRLALCLAALGRPAEGAAVCAEGLQGPAASLQVDPTAWPLQRTGRRLARKARVGWRPLPPLDAPRERRLSIPSGPGTGARPTFLVGGEPRVVEHALVAWLAALGRRARHVERALWTTLFALLLRPALFAPVPGALPSPLLHGPLDLPTAAFWPARAPLLRTLLQGIRDDPGSCLERALARHAGEAIVGARWDVVTAHDLRAVVSDLPGPSLAAVLEVLARDWRGARRGLPDLVVLPGAPRTLPHAQPARLGPGVLLVEVKTPTDRLSDAQRVWLHRLQRGGATVEVWRVAPLG